MMRSSLYRLQLGHDIQMGMTAMRTQSIVLALLGVVAAAVIPMAVSTFGVSLFWSQALGIIVGTLPIFMAISKREQQKAAQVVFPWLIAMGIATIVAFLGRRVWL